jgi:hypothetical protein
MILRAAAATLMFFFLFFFHLIYNFSCSVINMCCLLFFNRNKALKFSIHLLNLFLEYRECEGFLFVPLWKKMQIKMKVNLSFQFLIVPLCSSDFFVIWSFSILKRKKWNTFEKKNQTAEPLRPAGLPDFSGSTPVYTIFFRFVCTTVLSINRTGCRSGSRFDRPVWSGFDNLA